MVLSVAAGALASAGDGSAIAALQTFGRAIAHVESSYVDPVDTEGLVHGAIRGMVETLDPHSAYQSPEERAAFESSMEGHFGGIGVEIAVRDGWLTVLAVYPEGPAAGVGVRPGDRFVHIEGFQARDMRIADAVERMRGEPGTVVHVGIRREGVDEDVQLSITRAIVEVHPVTARVLSNGVIYVAVHAFQANTMVELDAALDRGIDLLADRGGVRGVLLDLRDNGGGRLGAGVDVADAFLSSGTITEVRGRGPAYSDRARAHRLGTRPDWPMVVLVNQRTASAAEIVAAALQDHERATVVGVRTFGKATVQRTFILESGAALKLTIARYYTPNGRSIQASGIEPDIDVPALDAATLGEARRRSDRVREEDLPGHLPAEPPGAGVTVLDEVSPVRPHAAARETPSGAAPFALDHQASVGLGALEALMRAAD